MNETKDKRSYKIYCLSRIQINFKRVKYPFVEMVFQNVFMEGVHKFNYNHYTMSAYNKRLLNGNILEQKLLIPRHKYYKNAQ